MAALIQFTAPSQWSHHNGAITMTRIAALGLLVAVMLAAASGHFGRALAVDSNYIDTPDLVSVRAKIKSKDFKGALVELTPMLQKYDHADVYNLMGFCLRKTGDQKQAFTFYRKALDLDPQHLGALEYLGELYVETGQIDKARENVALLKKLCLKGCEELADLEKTIARAASKKK